MWSKTKAMKRSELLSQYRDYLTLKNYRLQSEISYIRCIAEFLNFSILSSRIDWNMTDYAKAYLVSRFREGKSWSIVNIDYSAIRILVTHVLHLKWDYELVPRLRGRRSHPSVLSGRQVEAMINSIDNLKLFYFSKYRRKKIVLLRIFYVLIHYGLLQNTMPNLNKAYLQVSSFI